jgi:hypothetical protein
MSISSSVDFEVEPRLGLQENPWARGMPEYFGMLEEGATFLTSMIGSRLVGRGLMRARKLLLTIKSACCA